MGVREEMLRVIRKMEIKVTIETTIHLGNSSDPAQGQHQMLEYVEQQKSSFFASKKAKHCQCFRRQFNDRTIHTPTTRSKN